MRSISLLVGPTNWKLDTTYGTCGTILEFGQFYSSFYVLRKISLSPIILYLYSIPYIKRSCVLSVLLCYLLFLLIYCGYSKYGPILYSNLLYNTGHYFLDGRQILRKTAHRSEQLTNKEIGNREIEKMTIIQTNNQTQRHSEDGQAHKKEEVCTFL